MFEKIAVLVFVLVQCIWCEVNLLRAQPLLVYNETIQKFEINQSLLLEISHLRAPIKVISAVGDARIGKSTAFSILQEYLQTQGKPNRQQTNEVFKTCNSMDACTKGVWFYMLQSHDQSHDYLYSESHDQVAMTTYVLLDVEGIDLGDDSITTTLSLFTAFMSSDILLFVKETVNQHAVSFLYHMARMREAQFSHMDRTHFARLTVVVRDPLQPPTGWSLKDYVVDSLCQANKDDGMDEARKVIAKQFPSAFTDVREMPYVPAKFRSNMAAFMAHDGYNAVIQDLYDSAVTKMEEKRSIKGAHMDGESLVQVARSILDMMESDGWSNWENDWTMFERMLCRRSVERNILPLEELNDVDKIAAAMVPAVLQFEQDCVLQEEIDEGNKIINRTLAKLKAQSDRDAKKKEADLAALEAEQAELSKMAAIKDKDQAVEQLENIRKDLIKVNNELQEARRRYEQTLANIRAMRRRRRKKLLGIL